MVYNTIIRQTLNIPRRLWGYFVDNFLRILVKYMKDYLLILILVFSVLFAARLIYFIISHVKYQVKKKKIKFPGSGYRLFYSDEKNTPRKENVIYSKLLKSEKYGLQGKPDYIFSKRGKLLPVELKSGTIGEEPLPRFGDLLQLAAYFIIIEECFDTHPPYGEIIYSDYMFKIKNTKKIRKELLDTVEGMRLMLTEGPMDEPSCEYVKCRHCLCRGTVCEYCEF
ncbi:MAG: CRISPR-associated protein Cas4 [Lachnospiraceae bacterium]|nr:CRISPR-associated protein Cas4 [Lachnospiraceae bacterium]